MFVRLCRAERPRPSYASNDFQIVLDANLRYVRTRSLRQTTLFHSLVSKTLAAQKNGRMTSYNIWKIDVDGYLWGHSWPENFYRYNPRDSTMELAVRFWRKTGQIIWDYEKLN